MRKILFLFLLLVVVAAGIYYFAPWQRWSVLGYFHGTPAILATNTKTAFPQVLGAKAMQAAAGAVQNFAGNSGQVLGAAVSGFVGNAVTSAENTAKEAVVQQVANVLGVSTTVSNGPATGQSGVVISVPSKSGLEVCSAHRKEETVSYRLEFSSTAGATGYAVNWGDGQSTQSPSPAGTGSVVVSHAYGAIGIYSITFRLSGPEAATGTILAQKEVCII